MKKILILIITFISYVGFAQTPNPSKMSDAINKKMVKNEKYNPEQRAELETRKLSLQLNLKKNQKERVRSFLLEYFKTDSQRLKSLRTDKLQLDEKARVELEELRTASQKKLQEQLKTVLSKSQFSKYNQTKNRKGIGTVKVKS